MAAKASYSDLSEEAFFSRISNDQKSSEIPVEGSSGNLNAVQIKQKRHGNGKDMKVLEEVCRYKDINACKDTKIETKAKIIESEKTSTKAAIDHGNSISSSSLPPDFLMLWDIGNCMADALAKEGAGVLKPLKVYGIQSSWLNEVMNLGIR
uniref:Uncharacterized protein n=1 Tax=Populus alba TaxID=43335 RepID=A0A4U5QF57_POPAL|nr:hypothetical protein D5086_0000095580 [Populus alba]